MFGVDAANSRHHNSTGPKGPLTEQWKVPVASGRSSPAVVDGVIFVGSGDNHVYALDTVDGNQRWTFETGDEVASSPAVVDGTVYVGSDDAHVYAIDAQNGTEVWTYETGGEVLSSPAVVEETVYIGSRDGYVYALDTKSGDERWAFETAGEVFSSPAVSDGTVFVGSNDAHVYALDATDGSERWAYDTGRAVDTSPAVVDGTVYVQANDGLLYALDAKTATKRWTYELFSSETKWIQPSPAVVEDRVYIGRGDGDVHAVDATDGSVLWTNSVVGMPSSSPTVVDGTIYLGTEYGRLVTINIGDDEGEVRWFHDIGELVFSSPAVVDGTAYVATVSNGFAAVTAEEPPSQTESTIEEWAVAAAAGGTAMTLAGLGLWHYRWRGNGASNTTDSDGSNVPSETGKLGEKLSQVEMALDRAEDHIRAGRNDDASNMLSKAKMVLNRVETRASRLENEQVTARCHRLDRRRQRLVDTVTRNSTPDSPDATTLHSSLSFEYDDIEKGDIIGSGGNADVHRATVSIDDGSVPIALKEPRLSGTLHTATVERFLTEAETWVKLDDHDHIVNIVDYGSEPLPWIAMEYMDGGHLGERNSQREIQEALWTAIGITKAVRHAHRQGVAHLDLKPENVLFNAVANDWDVPKVADWGLSKHLLEHSDTVEGLSPTYAAPEQFDDTYGHPDDLTDVYQLGAVLYDLFTGRPPFEGPPSMIMHSVINDRPERPSNIANVPPEVDDILLKAMAKEKANRYESALLLRNELQDLYNGTV